MPGSDITLVNKLDIGSQADCFHTQHMPGNQPVVPHQDHTISLKSWLSLDEK